MPENRERITVRGSGSFTVTIPDCHKEARRIYMDAGTQTDNGHTDSGSWQEITGSDTAGEGADAGAGDAGASFNEAWWVCKETETGVRGQEDDWYDARSDWIEAAEREDDEAAMVDPRFGGDFPG